MIIWRWNMLYGVEDAPECRRCEVVCGVEMRQVFEAGIWEWIEACSIFRDAPILARFTLAMHSAQ